MISKVLRQLLPGGGGQEADGVVVENESCVELLECEDGDWIIINMPDHSSLGLLVEDPLENLLIEHPSMSVYQMRRQRTNEEDLSDEDDDSPRVHAVPPAAAAFKMGADDQRAGLQIIFHIL
ncbi:hypothetical protein QTP70_030452, partial [Hemibagrus guttatus]